MKTIKPIGAALATLVSFFVASCGADVPAGKLKAQESKQSTTTWRGPIQEHSSASSIASQAKQKYSSPGVAWVHTSTSPGLQAVLLPCYQPTEGADQVAGSHGPQGLAHAVKNDPDDIRATTRRAAVKSLSTLLTKGASVSEVLGMLDHLLSDRAWYVRIACVKALPSLIAAGIPIGDISRRIQHIAKDDSKYVAYAATEVLPLLVEKGASAQDALAMIQQNFSHTSSSVRSVALASLASLIDKGVAIHVIIPIMMQHAEQRQHVYPPGHRNVLAPLTSQRRCSANGHAHHTNCFTGSRQVRPQDDSKCTGCLGRKRGSHTRRCTHDEACAHGCRQVCSQGCPRVLEEFDPQRH